MTLYKKLKDIENELDKLNGEYGTKEGYCIFCYSKKYDGSVGIIHSKECVITQMRNKLKGLESE